MQDELLSKLSQSLEEKNEQKQDKKDLSFDEFFSNELQDLNEQNEAKEQENLKSKKPLEQEPLKEEPKQNLAQEPTAYDIYHAKKYGYFEQKYPELASNENPDALNLKLKKLSGEKEYQELQSINKALGNLNDIVSLSNDTSGTINALDRWAGSVTNNFLTPSEKNIQRANANSSLYTNYLNAVSLRSGGTARERAKISESVNFGAMNARDTRVRALKVADDLLKRQNVALDTLRAKGYDDKLIFANEGTDINSFNKNLNAYEYLKNNLKSFDEKDFESILSNGSLFNRLNESRLKRLKQDER